MLYLKKIEMYGFKSFADKIELKFDQPITGIVGPNGCGKSNVSDAIRWVLGEQSTKTLRGKSMQDLIFSGTDSRKSMGYCEVSLFMDNTTRIFPIQMDEIIISRKLYRNNESEYSLNRNVVRLRDIQDLLRNVGLGKEGYSIVGQGRMDAILNARPEDRRAIFEEALGISRFRVKKVETERKLEKTHINMDNLNVLNKELERQVEPLRKQAVNARKYLELYDKLRYNEINSYIYDYDNASQRKQDCRLKITGLNEELDYKSHCAEEVGKQYEELFEQLSTIDEKLSRLHEKHMQLAVNLTEKRGKKDVVNEKIISLDKEVKMVAEQIEQYNRQLENLKTNVTEGQAHLQKCDEEQQSLESERQTLNDKLLAINTECEKLQSETDKCTEKLQRTLRENADFGRTQASLNTEKESLMKRLAVVQAQQREISLRLDSLSDEEKQLLAHFDEVTENRKKLTPVIEKLKAEIKDGEYKLIELTRTAEKHQQEVSSEQGSIKLLKDFAENYRGYQASVQNLMQDAQRNQQLKARICGVVANLVKVDDKYQTAIETALGARLQNVVTRNEQDTKYVIDYLKANVYGRVTFLPVSSMKPRTIERPQVLNEQGVVGVAVDLVSFDAQYTSVFRSLLGSILVVDTFDNAVTISKKYGYIHRMVTLTGERIANDGSMEGGSRKTGNGSLLSYDSQIRQRTEKLKQLEDKFAVALSDKNEAQRQLEENRRQLSDYVSALQQLDIEYATDREKIEKSNVLNNNDKQMYLKLNGEQQEIQQRLEKIDKLSVNAVSDASKLSDSEQQYTLKIEQLRNLLSARNEAKEKLKDLIASKSYRIGVIRTNSESTQSQMMRDNREILVLKDNIEDRTRYSEQLNAAISLLYDELSRTESDDADQQEVQSIAEEIKNADITKADLNKRYQQTGEERMRLNTETETLRGAIEKEQYILESIDTDLEEMQQHINDDYGITYSGAMQYKDENFDASDCKQVISDLRASINKLGYVNVNAIEELKQVEERYGDISSQLNDLKQAESDLQDILKELTVEIEARFEKGMEDINENFKIVFRELFNGGNAKLTLDRDESKNSLDYGVEIEAQPPGKKLQNISLLSGGERTMTAAAILFAILKLHPMPFCVLDEIEAALDDANAERIARYLRKFSTSTQFVVITHKKPTMENADVLYGVTMEEKGVSKIVSVKLTEAIKQAM